MQYLMEWSTELGFVWSVIYEAVEMNYLIPVAEL